MAYTDMQNQPIHKFVPNLWTDGQAGGATQAVLSASQKSSLINVEELKTVNGKMGSLRVHYYPIDCAPMDTDCNGSICDTATSYQPTYKDFTPSMCARMNPFQVKIDDIRGIQDGGYFISDHLAAIFAAKIGEARNDLDKKITAKLIAGAGEFPVGTNVTTKIISLINANGSMDFRGINTIYQDFQDAGLSNTPYVVGGGDVFTWQQNKALAAANGGLDLSKLPYDNIWYDRNVDIAYADATRNHLIAFDPRLVKFISWSENSGKFATDLNGFTGVEQLFYKSQAGVIHGSIYDPVLKLYWDMNAMPVSCPDELFKVEIKLKFDLLTMPFKSCSNADTTGIFHYMTCPPAAITCS